MKPGYASDSPEFNLVLACVRWPREADDGDHVRTLAQGRIRWSYLLEIVHIHKVVPLVSRSLDAFAAGYVPDEVAAALRSSTIENAHLCLQRTSDLFALNRLFCQQQIDFRVFKGIPLAIAAFQDPTLRDAGDVDLLIAEKDLFKSEEILRAEGYGRFEPQAQLTPRRLRSYIAHQKDFSYEHRVTGNVIDLHWRLFRNPWLPANARLEDVGEAWFNLGSERVPTLPAQEQLLYLCVHGALDGWLRLKWLADIGALLRGMTADQLRSTAAAAAEQRSLPQFSAALLLCQDLLGAGPLPVECLDRSDHRVAHILRFSRRLMASNQYRPVREQIPSTQWFLNECRLHNSLRYRLNLVQRSLFRPRLWQKFDLPDSLFPLYAVLSPFEWLAFRLVHGMARLKLVLRRKSTRPAPRMRLPFRRLLQLPPADLALAVEAACMLTFFRVALRFLPVQKLTAWMASPEQTQPLTFNPKAAQTLRRIEWAIDAVVRHLPVTFVCFPQSLAAYFMLRRRHIASKLFYGVARDADQLKAHTWVKVGDRTVVGGEVEASFTVLTTFP